MHNEIPKDYSLWFSPGSCEICCSKTHPEWPCVPYIVGKEGPLVQDSDGNIIDGDWTNKREGLNAKFNTFQFFRQELEAAGARVDVVDRQNPSAWSGSVHDYKLIVYPHPNRSADCSRWNLQPCCSGDDGPPWHDNVFNLFTSDPWSGRIVILYSDWRGEIFREKKWGEAISQISEFTDGMDAVCASSSHFRILDTCTPEDFWTRGGCPGPPVLPPEFPGTLADGGCKQEDQSCWENTQINFDDLEITTGWPDANFNAFLFNQEYEDFLVDDHPLVKGLGPFKAYPSVEINDFTRLVYHPTSERVIARTRDLTLSGQPVSRLLADATLFNDRVGRDGPGYTAGQKEFWVKCFTHPPGS